jgi:hypothetical protein
LLLVGPHADPVRANWNVLPSPATTRHSRDPGGKEQPATEAAIFLGLPVPAEAPPHAPAEAYTLAAASVFLLLRASHGNRNATATGAVTGIAIGLQWGLLLEIPTPVNAGYWRCW